MSNNTDTKKLYAEYRAAMRVRDDKKAYTVLKEIVEADPSDTTAKMQCEAMAGKVIENGLTQLGKTRDRAGAKRILSELEAMFSEAQLNKYRDYVEAKERSSESDAADPRKGERLGKLRRSFREALLSHEKERAFELLEEICEVDPTDKDAQQQKKETGRSLCSQYAGEIQRLMRTGNMPELSNLVARMQRWANATLLEQIGGYKAAEELVKKYRRQEAEKEIARSLSELRAKTDITTKERYDEVSRLEEKAEKNAIEISGDDMAYITSVKKAREDEEKVRIREQVLAELGAQYTDILNSMGPISDASEQVLMENLPLLEGILRQATALGEYPEVEKFTSPVLHKLTDIRQVRRRRSKIRHLKACVKGTVVFLIVFLLIFAGYVCYSVCSVMNEMKEIRDEIKNSAYTEDKMAKLRVLISSTPFGFELTEHLFTDHRVIFDGCVKFVQHFDELRNNLAKVTEQMRGMYGKLDMQNLDASKIREYLPLIQTTRRLTEELQRGYHYGLSAEERQAVQFFSDGAINEMKSRFFAKYTTLPVTATLDKLEKLWLEYKDIRAVLPFSDDENRAIYGAFADAVRYILMCESKSGGPGISDLRSSLELFDRYCESMELDRGLRDEIADILQKMEEFAGIDTKIGTALSLAEYLKIIGGFESSYFKVPGLYDYRPLKEWVGDGSDDGKLRNLAAEVMAKALHALPRKWECDRELYEKIKRIYREERGVYLEYRENSIGVTIDRITKDSKAEKGMWKKELRVAVDNGVVYPGDQSRVNGTTLVRLLDERGNESGKVYRSSTVHGDKKLDFANMRKKIGFDSLQMLKGVILPIDLLRRTAKERGNSAYPVMALAWLFDETINLMESYPEPLANGIALSPSLKNDIKEFRSLPGHAEIKKGCWLLPHKLDYENALISFFAKCEGRDYKEEILQNLNKILNARLLYAGYIGENGQRYILPTYRGMNLYQIVWNQRNDPRLEPVTAHSELQRFTPVFVLK